MPSSSGQLCGKIQGGFLVGQGKADVPNLVGLKRLKVLGGSQASITPNFEVQAMATMR